MTTSVRFVTAPTTVSFPCSSLPSSTAFYAYLVAFFESYVDEFDNDDAAIAAGKSLYVASAAHDSAKKGTVIFLKS